jgi:hypothetical protein
VWIIGTNDPWVNKCSENVCVSGAVMYRYPIEVIISMHVTCGHASLYIVALTLVDNDQLVHVLLSVCCSTHRFLTQQTLHDLLHLA